MLTPDFNQSPSVVWEAERDAELLSSPAGVDIFRAVTIAKRFDSYESGFIEADVVRLRHLIGLD